MDKLINDIYIENKNKKVSKREIRDIIVFLNKKGKMDLDHIREIYNKSNISGLLLIMELKKFELNLESL